MCAQRVRLTRRLVETAKPAASDRFLWDADVIGFGLRLRPGGHRGYVLQYRHGGRSRRFSIGPHGSPWTVETARDRARVLLGEVAAGEDPQEAKAAARKQMTIGELLDLYLAEGMATRKESSVASARADIENHIKPLLGSKRAALVTRQDVERLLVDVAAGKTAKRARTKSKRGLSRVRGGKGAANAAVVTLSAAFGFAVAHKVRDDNPAWRVRRFPEKKLERFLSPAEFVRLGDALAAAEALGVEAPSAIAAIRLLILTGCRKSEILTLERAWIDGYHRCLRLPDSKTGAKIVHMGAVAMKIIGAIPEVPGNPFLITGLNGEGRLVNLQKPWERIRTAAGLGDVRLHDLRHAFASIGAANGDSLIVIGALLGHRSAKTTDRYAHLSDHPVKRAADRISAEIARLLGDPDYGGANDDAPLAAPALPVPACAASLLGEVIKTRWMDTPAAAAFLGFTVGTLQTYRWMQTGPAFRKIGRRVVYAQADLEAWRAAGRPPGTETAGVQQSA